MILPLKSELPHVCFYFGGHGTQVATFDVAGDINSPRGGLAFDLIRHRSDGYIGNVTQPYLSTRRRIEQEGTKRLGIGAQLSMISQAVTTQFTQEKWTKLEPAR